MPRKSRRNLENSRLNGTTDVGRTQSDCRQLADESNAAASIPLGVNRAVPSNSSTKSQLTSLCMVWESAALPLMICMRASRSSGSGRRSPVINGFPNGHGLARGNARPKERFISKSLGQMEAAADEVRGVDPTGALPAWIWSTDAIDRTAQVPPIGTCRRSMSNRVSHCLSAVSKDLAHAEPIKLL
jgi:hypothetical protein